MPTSRAAAILAGFVLLGATACAESATDGPATDGDGAAAHSTVSIDEDFQGAAKQPWRTVRSSARAEGMWSAEVTQDYVAFWDDQEDLGQRQRLTVQHRAGDEVGEEIVSWTSRGGDWILQDVWLTGDFAVVEEINETAKRIQLSVWDLRDGREVRLPQQPTQPEVAVDFDRVVFTTGRASARMCLQSLDLRTTRVTALRCAPPGVVLGDLAIGTESVLYSEVVAPGTPQRCKRLVVLTPSVKPVPATRKCLGWSGASAGEDVAWDEADPSKAEFPTSEGYLLTSGRQVPLGSMTTNTLVSCGNGFYWVVADVEGQRVEGWTRASGVRTLWGPQQEILPAGLQCSDGRWLSARFDDIDGVDESLTFAVLDVA